MTTITTELLTSEQERMCTKILIDHEGQPKKAKLALLVYLSKFAAQLKDNNINIHKLSNALITQAYN